MDKELIERMASVAGFAWIADPEDEHGAPKSLGVFACLVAEECAKLCEGPGITLDDNAGTDLASAIREKFKP